LQINWGDVDVISIQKNLSYTHDFGIGKAGTNPGTLLMGSQNGNDFDVNLKILSAVLIRLQKAL
jgi:hypothetical protein